MLNRNPGTRGTLFEVRDKKSFKFELIINVISIQYTSIKEAIKYYLCEKPNILIPSNGSRLGSSKLIYIEISFTYSGDSMTIISICMENKTCQCISWSAIKND